jgi:hypothetical protein
MVTGRAEPVAQPPRERTDEAHQQQRQRGAEGEQLAADMQFGRHGLRKIPKLWRTPRTDGEDEEAARDGGPIGA